MGRFDLRTRSGLIFNIIQSQAASFDADAQGFFDRVVAAGGSLTDIEKNAVNTLTTSLKSSNIWTSMKAVYPMVGGSAAACAQNLKSSSHTGTFSSGWIFSSTGAKPNGTSAFFNTNYSDIVNVNTNNKHISFYSRTQNSATNGINIGTSPNSTNEIYLSAYYSAVSQKFFNSGAYPTNIAQVNNTNTLGMHIGSQTSTTSRKLYFAGSLVNTNVLSYNTAYSTFNYYIGALNTTGTASLYTPHECAFASIGDGLSDTNASDFYFSVQAFQTSLSRNV